MACVCLLVAEILILATVDSIRCPGWYLPADRHQTSFWLPVVMIIVSAVAVIVYQARHWDQVVHRVIHGEPEPANKFPETPYEKFSRQYETEEFRNHFPHNRVFVAVAVAWTLFCAVPLFLMAGCGVKWPWL